MSDKTPNIIPIRGFCQCPTLSRDGISKINRVMLVSQFMQLDLQGEHNQKIHAAMVANIFSYLSDDLFSIHQELEEKGMLGESENNDEQ
ncbi:hypothetical protein AB6H35_25105 [Citrobacter freundii]|uniref:hypothetical protein n=1 Tax=Citrobacter freundii TaxID=546 RepID=UPI0034DD9547